MINEEEYQAALIQVEHLWDSKLNTPEYIKLGDLVVEIEAYEAIHYPIPKPTFWARVEYFFDTHRWWSPRVWLSYWWGVM